MKNFTDTKKTEDSFKDNTGGSRENFSRLSSKFIVTAAAAISVLFSAVGPLYCGEAQDEAKRSAKGYKKTISITQAIAEKNRPEIKYWIKKKKKTDKNFRNDHNTWFFAVSTNDTETVKLLVSNGFDPGAVSHDQSALHMAVSNNLTDMVRMLLKCGAKADIKDPKTGRTPLMLACASRHAMKSAAILLDNGADPNARDQYGETPLQTAVSIDNHEAVKLLISRKASITVKNSRGDNPVHMAVRVENSKSLDLLIKFRAGINEKNNDGDTPLKLSISAGRFENFSKLADAGADLNIKYGADGEPVLAAAFRTKNHRFAQYLIAKGADTKFRCANGETAMHLAGRADFTGEIEMLLALGADINAGNNYGETPILCAIAAGANRAVELLAAKGGAAAANSRGSMPLEYALQCSNREAARILIETGNFEKAARREEIGTERDSAMHIAAEKGFADMIGLMIEKGMDIEAKSRKGQTPLHLAAAAGKSDIIRKLLASGARVDAQDDFLQTPLFKAVSGRHLDAAKILIASGAAVNHTDKFGTRPVDFSVKKGNEEILKLLIREKADISASGVSGMSLLHGCIVENNSAAMKLLLEAGADPNSVSESGRTALHDAAQAGKEELADLLKEFGASGAIADKSNKTPDFYERERVQSELEKFRKIIEKKEKPYLKNAASKFEDVFFEFSDLAKALLLGFNAAAESLATSEAAVNAAEPGRLYPADIALLTGNYSALKMLINKKAFIGSINEKVFEQIDWLIRSGETEKLKMIVPAVKNIDTLFGSGNKTLLHSAVQASNPWICELLLARGADCNIEDGSHAAPIKYAFEKENLKIIRMLMRAGVKIKNGACGSSTPLFYAITMKPGTRGLVKKSRSVFGQNSVSGGVEIDDSEQVELIGKLIDAGAKTDPDYERGGRVYEHVFDYVPLVAAMRLGRADIAELLISKGAVIEYKNILQNKTPPYFDPYNKYRQYESSYARDTREMTLQPLHWAALNGHIGIAELILSKNCKVDLANENGQTAIYAAIACNDRKMAEFLIARGADLSVSDNFKNTPLHAAAAKIRYEIINSCFTSGETELAGALDMAELLISKGGDTEAKNRDGLTAMQELTGWDAGLEICLYGERRNGYKGVKKQHEMLCAVYKKAAALKDSLIKKYGGR